MGLMLNVTMINEPSRSHALDAQKMEKYEEQLSLKRPPISWDLINLAQKKKWDMLQSIQLRGGLEYVHKSI